MGGCPFRCFLLIENMLCRVCARNAGGCDIHSWKPVAVMGPRPIPALLGTHQSVFLSLDYPLWRNICSMSVWSYLPDREVRHLLQSRDLAQDPGSYILGLESGSSVLMLHCLLKVTDGGCGIRHLLNSWTSILTTFPITQSINCI